MDQFITHRINGPEDQYFAQFSEIYSSGFPLNERRKPEQQTAIFDKSGYQLSAFISDNQLVGFISFWMVKEFIFIEHFAIASEFRNQGKGNAILRSFIEKSKPLPILLEIELPVDKITRSRLRFYESLGFKMNDHNHYQPAYHIGDEPFPMKILSYPAEISKLNYQQFAVFQKEVVLG
jgi:ribosomal protein S18 acetylase RimI-like enzyme